MMLQLSWAKPSNPASMVGYTIVNICDHPSDFGIRVTNELGGD